MSDKAKALIEQLKTSLEKDKYKSEKKKKIKIKKNKKKIKIKSDEKEKESKSTNEDAPKRKRGRPFGSKTKQIAALDTVGYSALNEDAQRIWAMLEAKENDSAITLTQKAMLQTVIKMMPMAEERYFKSVSHQSVYAFNALVTQARELIADVQAGEDKSHIAHKIINDIIQPTIMSFASFMLDFNHQSVKQLKPLVKEKNHKELQDLVSNNSKILASYAQEIFANLKQRIPEALE